MAQGEDYRVYRFVFRITRSNQSIKGAVIEKSLDDARARVERMHKGVIESIGVDRFATLRLWARRLRPVKSDELALYFRQLQTMFQAGVVVDQCFHALSMHEWSPNLSAANEYLMRGVRSGQRMSELMKSLPQVFRSEIAALVRSGEQSGALSNVLERISDMLEKDSARERKLWSALTYPAVVAVISLLNLVLMVLYFLPRMLEITSSLNVAPSFFIRFLLGATELLTHPGAIFVELLGSVLVLILGAAFLKSEVGGRWFDAVVLRVPLVGRFLICHNVARLSYVAALMLECGLSLLEIFGLLEQTTSNYVLKDGIARARQRVLQDGLSMADAFREEHAFRGLFSDLLMAGEESGKVSKMMKNAHIFYQAEADYLIEAFLSLLEPIIMVVLGGFVATAVIGLLLPLTQVINNL